MTLLRWALPLAALFSSPATSATNWVKYHHEEGSDETIWIDLASASWHYNLITVNARTDYDPARPGGATVTRFQIDFHCTDSTVRAYGYKSYDGTGKLIGESILDSDQYTSQPGSLAAQYRAKLCAGHSFDPTAVF